MLNIIGIHTGHDYNYCRINFDTKEIFHLEHERITREKHTQKLSSMEMKSLNNKDEYIYNFDTIENSIIAIAVSSHTGVLEDMFDVNIFEMHHMPIIQNHLIDVTYYHMMVGVCIQIDFSLIVI